MKKLLSICLLSIFLLMFGMQAQAQRDCCFQLSNPAADTLHGIANMPGGDLPLSHYMSPLVFGHTDVYDMIFSDANCLGIEEGAKVSIELELLVDSANTIINVLDGRHDLSRYCNITLQTFYEELQWVGTPMMQENYSFVYDYPGARPIFSGTYNISSIAFDYFYFRFLKNTNSRIVITWNQIFRDVKLIVHIRERLKGTDNSLYWNSHIQEGEQYHIGGHMSKAGRVLASDTLPTIPYPVLNDTIKSCEPATVGDPTFQMDTTGDYTIAYVDTSCGYRIDSIVNYNYTHYKHPTTPTLSDSSITYCQRFGTPDTLRLAQEPDAELCNDHCDSIVAMWAVDTNFNFYEAEYLIPETDITFTGTDTTLYYYVKRFDKVTGCESEIDTFGVKITPIPAGPIVTDTLVEYCVGDSAVALTFTAPANQRVLWGIAVDAIDSVNAPVPSTTTAGTFVYYLKLQDTSTVNQCISDDYDSIIVKVYDNPTVTINIDHSTLCFGDTATMVSNPANFTTYQWQKDSVNITGATNDTLLYVNNVTDTTNIKFMLNVTLKHVVKSCKATDTVDVLAYPVIGAPTAVRGDTAICGPGTITREVENGTHASTSVWYDKNKNAVDTGTTYTHYYAETDTLYVSSINGFGCETPEANWTRIVVRVDSIPQITLTAPNNGEVCAESDLVIHSTVTSAKTPVTYAWSGKGLHAPLGLDSVVFNYDTAGVYTDTLKVVDANNCKNQATIDITVDSLPVIVLGVNYTIRDDSYCVGDNGKFEFTTPDYEKYSIDSMLHHKTTKVFDSLAVGRYVLMVENSKGCRSHATPDSIRDAIQTISMHLERDTNTHCVAPFGGKITVTNVTPTTGEYRYRYIRPGIDTSDYQTDTIFTALEHGFYQVYAEDTVTGCVGMDTVTVPTNQIIPTASFVGPNLICYLDSSTTFSLSYTNPNVVFKEWGYIGSADSLAHALKDSATLILGGFPAGKHIFIGNFVDTVTHCSGSRRDTVRVNSVNISLVSQPDYFVCEYDTIEVYSVYYPMEPAEDWIETYTWYNGNYVEYKDPLHPDTVIVIPSISSNFISLVAFDNHGCKNTFGKTMGVWELPALSINKDQQNYCQNKNIDIHVTATSTPPYSYEWKKDGTVVDTVHYFVNFNAGLVDFDVTLKVKDGHGCVSRDTIPVNVIEIPGAPHFYADTQYFCNNSVSIQYATPAQFAPQTAGSSFSWTGGNDPVATATTGNYSAFYTYTENGVSCYSDTSKLRVVIDAAPTFTVDVKYNSETTSGTNHRRCYNTSVGDTLKLTVSPAASSTLTYTYKWNGTTKTSTEVVTRTEPGVYIDTIVITATATYPNTTCEVVNTIYDTLTINGLPAVPDNFPNSYNGGDSTIFYCQADNHATYSFNIPTGYTATYNGSSDAPDTAANNVVFVITETATGCSSTFYYDIVKVATPHISLTSDLADNCSDTLTGKVVAIVNPTYDASYSRIYTWSNPTINPYAEHTTHFDKDTIDYKFIARVDTIVYARMTINAINAPYSASCASNDTNYFIHFQPKPDMPKLKPTYSHYIDSANAAYCYDDVLPIITVDSFMTSAGAEVTIVGHTSINTAGVYKVVANNLQTPRCPSDTLTFTVTRNRKIDTTSNFAEYGGIVYYCQGDTAVYNFGTGVHPKDSLVFFNGTTALTKQPNTAGNYILRVYDKGSVVDPMCSKDFEFKIIEVPTPSASVTPVTPPATWVDSNVCEGTTIDINYSFNITTTTSYTKKESYAWGIDPTVGTITPSSASAHYNFTPNDTTDVFFTYVLTDTASSASHGVGCSYTFTDTITYTFFSKPAVPVYKDTAFCAGDTIHVAESDFTFATGLELTTDPVMPASIYAIGTTNIVASVHYPTFTSCKSNDTTYHVVRFELPTVAITPHDTTICIGDTAKFTATGTATSYTWSTGATDDHIFATDSIKYWVIGEETHPHVQAACKKTDTVKLSFHPIFTVKVAGDTTVCVHASTNISATATGGSGNFNYHWYKDDTYSFADLYDDPGTPSVRTVTPDSSFKVNGYPIPSIYKLEVTDVNYHCKSDTSKNKVEVSAVDGVRFIFRKLNTTEESRYLVVDSTMTQTGFDMYITDEGGCPCDSGAKVYIEFQISKKDPVTGNFNPVSDAELASYLDKIINDKNTSYSVDMTGTTMYPSPFVSSYKTAVGHIPFATNISPMPGTILDYEWLYMHFLTGNGDGMGGHTGRRIRVTTGQWKDGSDGEYKFSYSVVKVINSNPNLPPEYPFPYQTGKIIGGNQATMFAQSLEILASDYFTFYVGTAASEAPTGGANYANAPAVVTPALDATTTEVMDMKVYPNPANNNVNVVLEGVQGQTLITIHDMSGKAVSTMRVDVDNNGQVFNLPVDNYSQGIYFIKVVNGSAIMTKKLIIAR
jgi:hypothetical protein